MLVAGGGGTGLGRLIAEVYAMKGVRGVAVLDIKVPEPGAEREEWEERSIRWFECDVGRREEVERVKDLILKEVYNHSLSLPHYFPLFTQPLIPNPTSSPPTPPSS